MPDLPQTGDRVRGALYIRCPRYYEYVVGSIYYSMSLITPSPTFSVIQTNGAWHYTWGFTSCAPSPHYTRHDLQYYIFLCCAPSGQAHQDVGKEQYHFIFHIYQTLGDNVTTSREAHAKSLYEVLGQSTPNQQATPLHQLLTSSQLFQTERHPLGQIYLLQPIFFAKIVPFSLEWQESFPFIFRLGPHVFFV